MQIYFRFLLVQFVLAIVMSLNSNAQNLILNPGFENGITGWSNNKNNGALANFLINTTDSPEGNKYFKCEVLKLGTNEWDVQIRSNEFTADESHYYRLTFKAKSDTPGAALKVYVQKNVWMGKAFSLSNSWKTYTYEFFPNELSKQLKFNFLEQANYYIDDILLEDITQINSTFNSPPSCVIIAPHTNAYFKQGTLVTINAYSTAIGGSGLPGEISKVEYFVEDEKIGESTTSDNNTYSFIWNAETIGEHRIIAVATDTVGKSFISAGVLISVGAENVKKIGLSAGKGKYLGNNVRNSGPEPTFTDYWNAVTSGNGGKWKTVERTRNVMNWEIADQAYNLAKANHLAYRYHTLAWGNQYPDWIKTLSPSEFQAESEEFMKAIAERYRYIDQIDVLNEALPGHQEDTKYFIDGLGGAGESGYDWAVWLFKKARQYFPNSKLILNDFAMVNSPGNIRKQLLLLKVLRDSALVDGFGAQAHTFILDNMQAAALNQNLDLMATSGIPIYITEMDLQGVSTTEASQLSSYQKLFPVLWEHPAVAGITLWGYIYGNMWKPDAGLVNDDGTERLSMKWLRNYMSQQEDVGFPFGQNLASSAKQNSSISKNNVVVYPNPAKQKIVLYNNSDMPENIRIYTLLGRIMDGFILYPHSKIKRDFPTGMYLVKIDKQQTIKAIVTP